MRDFGFFSYVCSHFCNIIYTQYEKTIKKEVTVDEVIENSISSKMDKESARHKNKSGIVVSGAEDVAVKFAKCCSPVPGDEIVGYVTKGKGIIAHRKNCPNIANETQRLVDVHWRHDLEFATYPVDILIEASDRPNLLVDIMKTLTIEIY